MRRYDLLSDLRDRIRGCLGADCAYRLVIARGRPPHECDAQIGIWLGDDESEPFEDCFDGACDVTRTFPVQIELVRICAAPQAAKSFDWQREEDEARCFYNDLDLIECCFDSGPWTELRRTHGIDQIRRRRTRLDTTSRGGAFSARIELTVSLQQCCDD